MMHFGFSQAHCSQSLHTHSQWSRFFFCSIHRFQHRKQHNVGDDHANEMSKRKKYIYSIGMKFCCSRFFFLILHSTDVIWMQRHAYSQARLCWACSKLQIENFMVQTVIASTTNKIYHQFLSIPRSKDFFLLEISHIQTIKYRYQTILSETLENRVQQIILQQRNKMNSLKGNSSRAKYSVALKSGIMGAINQFTMFSFFSF